VLKGRVVPLTWSEVEAGSMLLTAWLMRRRESTLTHAMRRLHRRRPDLFFIALGMGFGWLVQHVIKEPTERP
jgi:uncharacterized membrane protein